MNWTAINEEITVFKNRFIDFIDSIPKGPNDVSFIDDDKKMGIIQSTALGERTNLSARYYLSHTVQSYMIMIISTIHIEKFDIKIKEIIRTGKVPCGGKQNIVVNPGFIQALKEFWEKEINDI